MTQRYSAYKDSGVEWIGEIPEHWEVIKLKNVGHSMIGLTYAPENTVENSSEGTLVLRSSNILEGKLSLEDCVYVNLPIRAELKLSEGDILICSRNGSRALIGKNLLIPKALEGCTFGAFMTIFRTQYYSFISKVFNSTIFTEQSGLYLTSTINQLTQDTLLNIQIPFTSDSEEQSQIVEFLDEKTSLIDRLIDVKQRRIELLKEKRAALINHAVTKGLDPNVKMKDSGIEWIGEIPEHWEVKKLKYITSITYGISPSETTYNDEGVGTVLVNGPVEYSESDFGYTRSLKWTTEPVKFAAKGSLLFCLRGSTTGRMNITHMDLAIGRGVCAIISKQNQRFLMYSMIMVRMWIQNQISGSTFPSVTKDDVDNISICTPPGEEQNEIVSVLDQETKKIDDLVTLEQKKIDLLKEYRQALISETVTGKIKVTND